MKSFLSTAAVLFLAGVLVGCGGHSSTTPKKDAGMGDRRADMGMSPHGDGGPDGGDAGPSTCGLTGPKQANGAACACDGECTNGHCVEGVCCDSACTDGCETCTAPDAGGTCLRRTAGSAPRNASDCKATDATKCGYNGLCDGAGACQYFFGNTCAKGNCNGNVVEGASACDGTGVCRAGATTMLCLPYACNQQTGSCYQPPCSSTDQCDSQHQCNFTTGSCGTAGNGQYCNGNSDCLSGSCADHVCCNIACQGACVACNLPGRLGTCWPIDSGKPDPRAVCKDQGPTSCGHDGTCDGVGGCANYAKDTQCLQPSCTGNRLNTAGTCDGLGTCRAPGVQDCHPFRCVDGACTKSCETVADCDQGTACIAKTCGPKPMGASCQAASECSSNFCVDGVCCESACNGTCQYCALPTSPGFCMTVAADNLDPRGVCQDKGAASCGTNGKCDGTGSCETYAQGTVCGNESCTSGVYTPPSTCNTTGQCVAPDSRPCAPYVCNGGTQCFNVCATNDQCKPPNTCSPSNSCGLKGAGAVCGSNAECQSGLFCAQGFCCNAPCNGPCQSCGLPNSIGTCTNVPVNQVDPSAQCADQTGPSCGTNAKCDGNGGCQLYVQGTTCAASVCPSGTSTFTGSSSCDGAGKCVTPNNAPCFPYECGAGICKNSCTSNADCASPAVCNSNGSCGLKSPGQACVTAAECGSGFCSQSVCCATACTGVCQSCALPAAPGTCSNVANGTADPEGTCHDQGNTSCGTDGFCDGSGACRKYAGGTSCAPPSCPTGSSTLTSGRTCDGKGTCQAPSTISCAPYVCNGSTACKAACSVDADCLSPEICDPATSLCGNKKRLGQTCAATSDCLTNNSCVDGVCCSASSCGTCQACNVAGSPGNCANVPANTTAPHGLCAASPPCGNTGACDGTGKCQLGGTSVSCGTASCSGATFTPVSHCNGTGACAAPTSSACTGGFNCNTSTQSCKTTCTADTDCVAPLTCQGSGSTKSCALKPNGQTCPGGASQCISGLCTDGVCCGSGPCGTCQACNVNGLGSCAPIAVGTAAPSGQCPANGTCGNTGTCNGAAACTQAATSVSCGAASCSAGTATTAAFCSGSGTCTPPIVSTCPPYTCNGTKCNVTCSLDTDCVTAGGSNYYCTGTGGSCLAVKAIGVACFSNHECGSGACIDGVCCNASPTAGCGACQACNISGSFGTCTNVANTVAEPHGRCAANGTCGNTGSCNGAGACAQAATNVSCASASCSGTTFTPGAFCSGGGTCSTPATSSCAPYICGGTSCNVTCSLDTDCVPSGGKNSYCSSSSNGSCLPVKANGVVCLSNHECSSGACIDGVCCNTTPALGCGTCQACNVAGSLGTCTNVPNTAAEPHGRCATNGTCGNTGSCNGAGACTQAATTVSCAPPACSGTTFTPTAFCSGSGTCSTAATSSCAPYLCGGTSCAATCNLDTDCVPSGGKNSYCSGTNGSCLPVKTNGVACLGNHECGSGACIDGVCCNSSPTTGCGSCQACNVTGSLGTCANVPSTVAEPHGRCPASGTCGNTGACDGNGACQQQPATVMCSNPSCTGATATLASFCSGSGSCPTAATASCGEFLCGATACSTTCGMDSDCKTGDYCTATSNGVCKPKNGLGTTCGSGHECGSGFCIDGVCCQTNGCGTCSSCNLNGLGTCAAIASGTAAPAGQCPLGAACGNTGLCNGSSGCQQQASGASCGGSTSCASGSSQFTAAPACNGAGSCVTPSPISCGAYTCTASGCPNSCAADGNCATGSYCNGTHCVPQQTSGACTKDDQCLVGGCANGFCCAAACPACQTCGATGCENLPDTTVCASSCAADNSSLSQTFCSSGACLGLPVVTTCPSMVCDGTLLGCL
ncbi:MAG TPA: hypothetical protein VH853_21780 [Polyangia bacterium]|nr:hypothetical protein [Polyangia bacterium]